MRRERSPNVEKHVSDKHLVELMTVKTRNDNRYEGRDKIKGSIVSRDEAIQMC